MLPDDPARGHHELMLQLTRVVPLTVIKGYGTVEVERTLMRALELCRQVGDPCQHFEVFMGLAAVVLIRGELQRARELQEQALEVAQQRQDRALLLCAHAGLGETLFFVGELAAARTQLEHGSALYRLQPYHSGVSIQNPGMSCLAYLAWTLWVLGYPQRALRRAHEALALALARTCLTHIPWLTP